MDTSTEAHFKASGSRSSGRCGRGLRCGLEERFHKISQLLERAGLVLNQPLCKLNGVRRFRERNARFRKLLEEILQQCRCIYGVFPVGWRRFNAFAEVPKLCRSPTLSFSLLMLFV